MKSTGRMDCRSDGSTVRGGGMGAGFSSPQSDSSRPCAWRPCVKRFAGSISLVRALDRGCPCRCTRHRHVPSSASTATLI